MFGNDRDRKHSEYEFVWERPGSKTFGVRISNGIDLNKKLSEVRERKGAIGGDWEQPESNTKSGFERKSIFFGVESNSSFRAGAAHGKLPAPTPGRATPPPPYLRGKHFAKGPRTENCPHTPRCVRHPPRHTFEENILQHGDQRPGAGSAHADLEWGRGCIFICYKDKGGMRI